jgi:FkbM family methyltransferase
MFDEKSYSQCGEDRIAAFLLNQLTRTSQINYLDLGAAFPVGGNNTYLFYELRGVGVIVEADPQYLPEYQLSRPKDCVVSGACVPARLKSADGITFHAAVDRGLSSIFIEHVRAAESFGKGGLKRSFTVPCFSIGELLDQHFGNEPIDLLSVDIEGADREILQEVDYSRYRPKIIIAENDGGVRIHDDCMQAAGYKLFAYTTINSIYFDLNLNLGF